MTVISSALVVNVQHRYFCFLPSYWLDWLPYYSNRTKFSTRIRGARNPVQATDGSALMEEEEEGEEAEEDESSNESTSLLQGERVSEGGRMSRREGE